MSRWIVLVLKIPAEPSRHRVAVWRELRKIGALSLGQGVWAVPDVPVFADGLSRAIVLTEQAGGQAVALNATGRSTEDASRFQALFTAARSEDWTEFLADCGKFEAELAKEIRIAKFTLAELEEEEQSLERLRRWHRDLTARDVFGAPEAPEAARRLRECATACEDYAERVFAALHGPAGDDRPARLGGGGSGLPGDGESARPGGDGPAPSGRDGSALSGPPAPQDPRGRSGPSGPSGDDR